MSWSDRSRGMRVALLTVLVSGAVACGFTPVEGPSGAGANLRGTLRAAEPANDTGFAFVRQVENRLGRANDARYDLTYRISTSRVPLAIDDSNDITRVNIEGTLTWAVTPLGGSRAVLSGEERSFTAYSATGSTIATFESQRDANRRLAILLADKMINRLFGEADALAP